MRCLSVRSPLTHKTVFDLFAGAWQGSRKSNRMDAGIQSKQARERARLSTDMPLDSTTESHSSPAPPHSPFALEDLPILNCANNDDLDSFTEESDLKPSPAGTPAHIPLVSEESHRLQPSDGEFPGRVRPRESYTRLLSLILVVLGGALGLSAAFVWSRFGEATVVSLPKMNATRHDRAPDTTYLPSQKPSQPGRTDASDTSDRPFASANRARKAPQPHAPELEVPLITTLPQRRTADSLPNVTGSWKVATYVESSSYSRFNGLRLGYDLTLKQTGDRVTGSGRKVTENGKGIARRAQTPVALIGTVERDQLNLDFIERGTRRSTKGTFLLVIDEKGTLTGRFSSEAAKSSGRVEAHPIITQ